MSSATYSELLRENRDFRRLWAGQMVSELGSWFSFIAELGLVRMLSGSALITTALLVARLLPFLLVAPFAGVLTDRKSRKQIMISADLLRGVVALLYVLAGAIGSAWMVVGCAALMASLTMFFEAAKNASIPNIVSPRELLTANVLMFSTRFLQYTIGSALGGVTAAQFGYNVAFVVNSLSFVASAFFLVLIPGNRMRQVQPGSQDEFAKAITFESEVSPEPSSDQPVVRPTGGPKFGAPEAAIHCRSQGGVVLHLGYAVRSWVDPVEHRMGHRRGNDDDPVRPDRRKGICARGRRGLVRSRVIHSRWHR